MKRLAFIGAFIGAMLVGSVAVGAAFKGPMLGPDLEPRFMKAGFYSGKSSALSTTNAVTNVLGQSAVIDFASATITCTDSSGITVTGALAGDPCFVGPPTTVSGAATGLNSTFSCYVSAADTVKVRHCAAGTADDPASATFFVRVISSQ